MKTTFLLQDFIQSFKEHGDSEATLLAESWPDEQKMREQAAP